MRPLLVVAAVLVALGATGIGTVKKAWGRRAPAAPRSRMRRSSSNGKAAW